MLLDLTKSFARLRQIPDLLRVDAHDARAGRIDCDLSMTITPAFLGVPMIGPSPSLDDPVDDREMRSNSRIDVDNRLFDPFPVKDVLGQP